MFEVLWWVNGLLTPILGPNKYNQQTGFPTGIFYQFRLCKLPFFINTSFLPLGWRKLKNFVLRNEKSMMSCRIFEYVYFQWLGKQLLKIFVWKSFSDKENLKNLLVFSFLYRAICLLTLFSIACVTALVEYCTLINEIMLELSTYLLQKF